MKHRNPVETMANTRHEFGEHGGVNMSVEASTTFTVLKSRTMPEIFHGEKPKNTTNIKRFVGYYEPLFKDIPMYRPIYYWQDGDEYLSVGDNYVFGDNLEQFATISELMYSKVNDEYNVLKLKNTDTDRSVYPMVDEIGLSQTERFIYDNHYIKLC